MSTLQQIQEDIRNRFKLKPAWTDLADTEMVGQMSDLLGALFHETLVEVESARQDAFLTTATSRAAVLAHAADRGYRPPRPKPPGGIVSISNGSTLESITVPESFELLDNDGISYLTEESIVIPPGSTTNVRVQHLVMEQLQFSGNGTAYQEKEISDWQLVDVHVQVLVAGIPEDVEFVEDFWNSSADDWVVQLIYNVDDHWRIRFGNGEFGCMPTLADHITVDITKCDPNHRLLQNQKLYPVNSVTDSNGQTVALTAKVVKSIEGGVWRATTERIREEAKYWRNQARRLVWASDYELLLKTELPELGFVKVWGESEQEAQDKQIDYRNVNKIFVSAYSTTNNTDLSLRVLDVLQAAPHPVSIQYQYVESLPEGFSLLIKGALPTGISELQLKTELTNLLLTHYGKNSASRRDVFLEAEAYELILQSKILETTYDQQTKKRFEFKVTDGVRRPSYLQGFVYLEQIEFDIDNY